jgi:hypothetical protein
MRLLVLHDHYALCLNVDPGPERLWKLLCHFAISGQMVSRNWSWEFAATGILQFLRVSRNQSSQ